MSVLHSMHFFILGQQSEQTMVCPHGSNFTGLKAFFIGSKQIWHSKRTNPDPKDEEGGVGSGGKELASKSFVGEDDDGCCCWLRYNFAFTSTTKSEEEKIVNFGFYVFIV